MKIELKKIKIRELVEKYKDDAEEGVYGYGGKLNIRPPYQREFVYDDKKRNAVIDTLKKGFPLSIFYWSKNNDGTYELLDGQQRTVSICQYVNGDYSVDYQYFFNLAKEQKEQILDYEILVYICEGDEFEKLEWFKTINIASVPLTTQELRNAMYCGKWLLNAKAYFSKTQCPAYNIGDKLMSGSCIRQEYLEKALYWISDKEGITIEEYMAKHQNDSNAAELWSYYTRVISWVNSLFSTYRKEMKGLDWGILYNKYSHDDYNIVELEENVKKLMIDEDVTNKKGIYEYLLSHNDHHLERKLNIRAFSPKQAREAYERQDGICPKCGQHFELKDMQADHIIPWAKGGTTTSDNCQMLCKNCNRQKSDI